MRIGEGEGIVFSGARTDGGQRAGRHADPADRRRRARQGEFAFLGTKLRSLDVDEAATWLLRQASSRSASGRRRARIVTHANAHNLHVLRRAKLVGALERDGQIFLEGIGMKLAALSRGHGWRRDANGTDMAPLVFEGCERFGIPIFLLGGRPPVLARAVRALRERYPALRIAGARHGYLTPRTEQRVVGKIRASGAALLVQGRGCPTQEQFALRWADELGVNVIWNVGGLFDFIAGERPRAPRWMRRARLEWLFRLGLEPRRLASRSVVSFPALLMAAARDERVKNP